MKQTLCTGIALIALALALALPITTRADMAPNGPTISRVTNNSSDIPSGFPNSGISQGALFKVVGTGLADDGDVNLHDSGAPGGLPTTLNTANITVTAGGTTVAIALYYATPTQIDGVMPANMPTGPATLTVTHNGTASITIQIVTAAPGITTYNNGTAVAQDFARPTDPYGGLITFVKSAVSGGIITIWGSGFGATSDDDVKYTDSPHATSVSYTIYIGGVQVTSIAYAGRSVYPGVSIFVVTIPQNVPTGCYVPIAAVTGNVVSNTATLPIHAGGGVCSDPQLGIKGEQISTLTGQSTVKTGTVIVSQFTGPQPGTGAPVTINNAIALFEQVTGASYAGVAPVSIGGCIVIQAASSGSEPGRTFAGLDAGTIILTGPSGDFIPLDTTRGITGSYNANPYIPLTGGAYMFNGQGGTQVGKFTTTVNFPNPLLKWTNQSAAATVTRGQGLLVTWTSGAPGTYVTIIGNSTQSSSSGYVSSGTYTCIVPVALGQFTVPSYVLLSLPAAFGGTIVQNSTNVSQFSAGGLDLGTAVGYVNFLIATAYN